MSSRRAVADARRIFIEYRAKPGSREIASRYALSGLISALERRRPRLVLEFGPGIGTTTAAIITALDRVDGRGRYSLWCVEPSEFCRRRLADNVGEDAALVVERFGDLPADAGPFDFVVVDGPADVAYCEQLSARAVVFVENDRRDQRDALLRSSGRRVAKVSRWPIWSLSRMGGYHIFQFEPTIFERVRFGLRAVAERAVPVIRRSMRQALGRVGLGSLVQLSDRRASEASAPLDAPRRD